MSIYIFNDALKIRLFKKLKGFPWDILREIPLISHCFSLTTEGFPYPFLEDTYTTGFMA